MSKILDILEKEYPNEKSLILHRNFQVKFKDLLKSETLDLEKIQEGDVVAIIGDYEPATIGCVEWMVRYQDITTVGYSFDYKKYSKLNVFRYFGTVVEEPNYMKFIPRPASVWPGDSGGGVFAKFQDKNYVVGIISNYIVIETFNGRIVVSECSATIIVKYLDWIGGIQRRKLMW